MRPRQCGEIATGTTLERRGEPRPPELPGTQRHATQTGHRIHEQPARWSQHGWERKLFSASGGVECDGAGSGDRLWGALRCVIA